jgi:ribonuclease J
MNSLSLIPLGGTGNVTKNMYLYELANEILIVDCGLGFPDQAMLGVDLLLPDVTYLKNTKKKIVGMLLTHGHEDHFGALPFVLPELPKFPIFGTTLTASFANSKLQEFKIGQRVQATPFNKEMSIGSFKFTFIRVTHSVPDTSHIFIKTPVGNFYHGSDFKFDPDPFDGKKSDFEKIREVANQGVLALLSDCLGSEKQERVKPESSILPNLEREIRNCRGKFILTSYSSNISRFNQAIEVSQAVGRKICIVGRSLTKAMDAASELGYLKLNKGSKVDIKQIRNYKDSQITFLVAGTQGEEASALTRIATGEFDEIKLRPQDTVVISAAPIPGNEISVYELINTIAKKGTRVLYTDLVSDIHVSGHGSAPELADLIKMVKPKKLIPIGGEYRHMAQYRNLAKELGYKDGDVFLPDDGQEIIFSKEGSRLGKKIQLKNVYVDEISGEEMDSYILMDRQKLSEGGMLLAVCEINSLGRLEHMDIIEKGLTLPDGKKLKLKLTDEVTKALVRKEPGKVTDWSHIRKEISRVIERRIFREFKTRPLVLPVVIEV